MSLYGAVLQVVQNGDETPFTQKVKDFYDRLTALRRMARSAPAEQLLEEIFVSTGYLAALGVLENGAHRREDARRFAAFCAQTGAKGISALVRAIDAAAQAGSTGQDTVPGGARPGCVTIMTTSVHHTWIHRFVRNIVFFFNKKCIHIRTQQDGFPIGTIAVQGCNNASIRHSLCFQSQIL